MVNKNNYEFNKYKNRCINTYCPLCNTIRNPSSPKNHVEHSQRLPHSNDIFLNFSVSVNGRKLIQY